MKAWQCGPIRLCTLSIPLVLVAGCSLLTTDSSFEAEVLPLPAQLPQWEPMKIPGDNPLTPEKAALGRQLFFDPRLSAARSVSCASCHQPERGLSDPRSTAIISDAVPARNAPTLWNIGYATEFYRDGRVGSLEEQAMTIWTGPAMGADPEQIAARLNSIPGYRLQFKKVFGSDATPENIVKALAAFERTLISGDTAWDRWQAGDESAVSDAVKRGYEVFRDSNCEICHDGVFFTDFQHHNIGVGSNRSPPDTGRFEITQEERDFGAFKTPTLRDVARTGPYFHDGSAATLEEAVEVMAGGGIPNQHHDEMLEEVPLSTRDKEDLLAFLRALTVRSRVTEPRLP